MVLIFIAMLFCIQVRAYPTHLGEVRSNWVEVAMWRRRMAKARLERALPGFKVRKWRQKVTFHDDGRMTITQRWYIKHKWALLKLITSLLFLAISWHFMGVPIGVVGAVITSNGGGGGNWSVGGSWVGGVAPGIADDAIVAAGDTINVDLGVQDCLSIEVQIGGTLHFPGPNNLRTNGINAAGFCVDMDGTLIHGSGLFTLIDDTANNAKMDWVGEGGNPFDILVTYRDWTTFQDTNCHAEGTLTITTGTWDTEVANDYDLNVDNTLTVTTNLLCNGSTVTLDFDLIIGGNMDFEDGTLDASGGRVTTINGLLSMGTSASHVVFCSDLSGSGSWNLESSTVTAKVSGSGNIIATNLTINAGTSLLVIEHTVTAARTHAMATAAGNWNDIQLSTTQASGAAIMSTGLYILDGDLTVDATCTWDTNTRDMTVTGDVDVTGTLDGGSADVIIGSLTVNSGGEYDATTLTTTITFHDGATNALWTKVGSTLTHNNGTITFTATGANQYLRLYGTGNSYNVICVKGARGLFCDDITIDNDLTITSGIVRQYEGITDLLTVIGDVDVTGTLGDGSATAAFTFGSLTINSGGTYDATSGTTTITTNGSVQAFLLIAGGTFTHNNGTFEFNWTGGVQSSSPTTYYDLIVDKSAGVVFNHSLGTLNVANDLTITSGTMQGTGSSNRHLIVTGDVSITGQLNGRSSNHTYGSVTINSGGILSATTLTTTITDEAGGYALDNNGGTYTHNDGLLVISGVGDPLLDPAGSSFYDLQFTQSGRIATNGLTTIDNDLTIDAGAVVPVWRSSIDRALTVTGDVNLSGQLSCNVNGSGPAISMGSLKVESGGNYSATLGTTTMTNVPNGASVIWTVSGGTFTHNNGLVDIETGLGFNEAIRMSGTGGFYDITFSNNAQMSTFESNVTVANDLTVESGSTLGLGYPGVSGRTWTVTGDVIISGTIDSTVGATNANQSFGSLTINSGGTYTATSLITTITSETAGGYAVLVDAAGVLTHNNGTLTFTYNSTTLVDLGGDSAFNFIVNHATIVVTLDGNGLDVANDLTVTAGEMDCLALGLSVTGDVDLSDVLDGNTSAVSMGSLTIQAGGLYDATDATTSITSETAGGDAVFTASGGTYIHNSGLLEIVSSTDTRLRFEGTGNPHDLEYNAPGQTVTLFGANLTVENSFTITDGEFDTSTLDLAVAALISITGILTCNSSTVDLGATVIEIGGTLTAPDGSGALTISNWFDNSGTFTHSDGTVTFDGATGPAINQTGTVEPVFYNMVIDKAAGSWEVAAMKDITVEAALTITTGKLVLDGTSNTVTLTMGTVAVKGLLTVGDTLLFANNTTNRVSIVAASDAFPCEVSGSISWDSGGNLSLVTVQDLQINDAQTVGTDTVTVTATRCYFIGALTVTTATLEGTMCTIDVTNLTVSSGLYIEGWFDLTDNTRGGYDWILVAGDYTISTNKTYTSRQNFYKPGGATLTLDTGTTLTATDPTVDGTFITAEADLLDTNNGIFTVKYTMDIKIVDALGVAIQSVVVTLYDQFDVQLWTQTTDSNGDITAQVTITAIYGIGARQNHPQNMTIVLTGFATLNWNFVLNRPMDYTIGLPAAATPSTGGDSAYTDDLTIYRKIGRDDAAQKQYDGGTSVKGSVQQKRIEIDSPTGKVINSTTVIYVPAATAVDVEDKILLEDTTTVQVVAVKVVNAYDGTPDHKVIST